jgi:hypothetical protein
MRLRKALIAFGVTLLSGASIAAQGEPGTISAIEFQTPKNGMTKQYEEARKQKVAWHKQQKDSQPLFVLQVLTGEHTGWYIVGRFDQHWADFDKPSVPDAADLEQYNKLVAPYVEKITASYFEFLPKISNPGSEGQPKYTAVTTFHIKYGKGDDFRSAIARMHDAAEKTKWPFHYGWDRLANGGPGGTYVLLVDHPNWASFGDDPAIKPLRDILREAFGEQEAMSVIERLNGSIESTYSEIVELRADLSYIPGK